MAPVKRIKETKKIDFRGKKVMAERYIAKDRNQKEHDDTLWVVTEEAKKKAGL